MSSSPRFVVNSNSLFLCGTGDGVVTVVDTVTDLNSASYSSDSWKIVAAAIGTINANKITSVTKLYRGLEIFGAAIEGSNLDKLCDDLFSSKILVNRDGYLIKCFNNDKNGISKNASGGLVIGNMVKLNNMFGWGRYGVRPAEVTTVWNRYDVVRGEAVVDYVAAEERQREIAAELEKQRKEMGEWKLKAGEKDETEKQRKEMGEWKLKAGEKDEMEKQRKEMGEWKLKAGEKDEILGHYKRILEEFKEVMKEKESGKERLREVIEEKNRVVEEQSRVIREKEVEIQSLKLEKKKKVEEGSKSENGVGEGEGELLKEKVVGDDVVKTAMDSLLSCCRKELKEAMVADRRVFFVIVVLALLLL